MNVTGIIAEYNPFHLGHLHQIAYVREKLNSDYIIVAMSGDFVQRGTPALLSKYIRAEAALLCGADLVLELPVQVSSASAEFFAGGAVSLLNGSGVVDQLCFGSEEGSVEGMQLAARILNEEPQGFRDLLKNSLKQGMSFPAARSQALGKYLCTLHSLSEKNLSAFSDTLLSSPNNILGIEYCRALLRLNSTIKPVTLKREGSGYHDLTLKNNQAPSASAVRAFLSEKSGRTPSSDSVKDFS
ncbi:MAG: nucleotidyltransferase family protein, partial [Blautia caecimuris]